MNRVLISIAPEHAENIYQKIKKAELRKSFAKEISQIIIYETTPVRAITGILFVDSVYKEDINNIMKRVESYGVPVNRAEKYFQDRSQGWLIPIKHFIRFEKKITLNDLNSIDHGFKVPQSFIYLNDDNPIWNYIRDSFLSDLIFKVKIAPLRKKDVKVVSNHILDTVSKNYSEIDSNFLIPLFNKPETKGNSFSTKNKTGYGFYLERQLIGYTFFSKKFDSTIKTGPTAIFEEYNCLGFGKKMRELIKQEAERDGIERVFCTVPSTNHNIINNLISSGFTLGVQHKQHLKQTRDELIFYYDLRKKSFETKKTKYSCDIKNITSSLLKRKSKLYSELFSNQYFSIMKDDFIEMFDIKNDNIQGFISQEKKSKKSSIFFLVKKRSNMIKLFFLQDQFSIKTILGGINYIEESFRPRKIYLHVSLKQPRVLNVLLKNGFKVEGIIPNQYSNEENFVHLGKLY